MALALSENELRVLRALARNYNVEAAFEIAVACDFRAFTSYGQDWTDVLEWAMIVTHALSEGRVAAQTTRVESWAEVQRQAAAWVAAAYEQAKQDADDPTVDPWGPQYTGPVNWWVQNMTAYMVFAVYQHCRAAAMEVVQMELQTWTLSPTASPSPAEAAHDAFNTGMLNLSRRIDKIIKEAT